MTYENECTLPESILEQLTEQGFETLPELMRLLINLAMRLERQRHLNAAPFERTAERTGHANGFKPKTMQTRLGAMTLAVPQVRDSSFYPQSLEKGLRSERALKLALAEM